MLKQNHSSLLLLLLLFVFTTESVAQKRIGLVNGLKILSVTTANSNDYSDYNLLGKNKPNGIIYRFRKWKAQDLPVFLNNINADIIDNCSGEWLVLQRDKSIASLYGASGKILWTLDLNEYVEEKSMEVQDIHFDMGILYFNAACISYSSGSGGLCSSLYAINPVERKRIWKSDYLVSNDIFLLTGELIVAGYGFTAEPDYLYLIDRKTGNTLNKTKLDSAHKYMEFVGKKLNVITYNKHYIFDFSDYF